MRVLFFGIYNPEYSRNKVLMSGFRDNGYEVVECRIDPGEHSSLGKFWALFKLGLRARRQSYNYTLVAFPGHSIVWLARALFGRRIVFDAFVSLYNSEVEDRGKTGRMSLRALYYQTLDEWACRLAGKVLLDTNAHIDYFVKNYRIQKEKFIRVFVGSTSDVFYPSSEKPPSGSELLPIKPQASHKNSEPDGGSGGMAGHFHGSYIPLQGVGVIVRAIAMLKGEGVTFTMVGDGPDKGMAEGLASRLGVDNINFIDKMTKDELRDSMGSADVCLGIFGDTQKAQMVIPNKVYEALACGRPVITMDSPAARELLSNKTAALVDTTPEALAAAILELKANPGRRSTLASAGYQLFLARLQPGALVTELLKSL